MNAPLAKFPVPRPKPTDKYDRRNLEQSFQSLERDLQEKYDRRSDLVLPRGFNLVVSSDDGSTQYGLGVNSSGKFRLLDYSDGSIGTFTVAWAQVDGAAEEITTLTSYVDTQDAALQSSITSNSSAITTNTTSIATINTELIAARDGETDLAAKITAVETAFAAGDAAEASARASLQATLEAADTTLQSNIDSEESSRVSGDSANATSIETLEAKVLTGINPNLALNPTGAEGTAFVVLNSWNRFQPVNDTVGGWGFQAVLAASESPGTIYFGMGWFECEPGEDYIFSVEIENSGLSSITNISVSVSAATDDAGTGNAFVSSTPYSSDITDTRRRLSNTFTMPSGKTHARILCNHTNPVAGGSGAILNIRRLKLERGSTETAYSEGSDFRATVSILKDAFVDGDGNAIATVRLVAAASGGDPATIELLSSDGVSAVRLGGDTEIDGDLVVNGTITTDGLATNAVTNTEVDQTSGAITPSNNTWTDVASFSFTSVGIGVQLRGSCEVDVFSDGTGPTAQVRLLRGATVLKTSKVFTSVDAGSGFVKVEQSVALDYNDLPSTGSHIYKLQARLNEGSGAVVVSTFDVTNRFLSATELKR